MSSNIKGLEKFREKIPKFAGNKIILLLIYFVAITAGCFLTLPLFDAIPGIMNGEGSNSIVLAFFPLFGVLLIGMIGFLLDSQLWFQRDRLKKKYGALSYQHIFIAGFTGVTCLIALSINLYLPFWMLSPSFWSTSPLGFLAFPLETYTAMMAPVIFCLKTIFSAVFLVLGILLMMRSVMTFGIDYLTNVYLYFPEESEIQDHDIYIAIRNPMYGGMILIALGGTCFTLTILSMMFFCFYFGGFYIFVHFIEEKELIKRFGSNFREYCKRTPAFFVNPRKLGILFRFLRGKGRSNDAT